MYAYIYYIHLVQYTLFGSKAHQELNCTIFLKIQPNETCTLKKWKLNQWYIPISKCLKRYSYCLGLNTHQLCCKCIPEYVTAYNPEHIKSWQSYMICNRKNNVENTQNIITTAHEHLHEQIAKDMIPHYYQVFWIVEIFLLSRQL